MTGVDHYREAERLLDLSERPVPNGELGWMARAQATAEAQVHATLALAAATALSRFNWETGFPQDDRMAWLDAASEKSGRRHRAEIAEAAEFEEAQR